MFVAKFIGYQKGTPDGFRSMCSLDSVYVEGVSITTGSPRKYVWTFDVGLSDDHNYPVHVPLFLVLVPQHL